MQKIRTDTSACLYFATRDCTITDKNKFPYPQNIADKGIISYIALQNTVANTYEYKTKLLSLPSCDMKTGLFDLILHITTSSLLEITKDFGEDSNQVNLTCI